MSKPLVSIITPTYKHEAYIGECIESVLKQTYDNWEQIIVDDCSPDFTVKIAKRYNDPRIRIIKKPIHAGPEGLHDSYNTALQMARGELIAVLEGDDYWMEDKLAIQVPFHLNNSIVLSWGGYFKRIGGQLKKSGTGYSRKPKKCPDTSYLLIRNNIPSVTVMVTKSDLLQAGGFWQPKGTVFVDHPTWLKLSIMGDFLYIPQPLGIYRMHENQISNTHRSSISFSNYSYPNDFVSQLSKDQMKLIDFQKIQSLKAAFAARDSFCCGKISTAFKPLADAFRKTSMKNKYLCLKVIVGVSEFP